MFKKFLKIISLTFISICALEVSAWVIAANVVKNRYSAIYHPFEYTLELRHVLKFDEWYHMVSPRVFRRAAGLQNGGRPNIIFGCSFAYGSGLSDNQTLSYKLAKIMHVPVFNRAIGGAGVQHMLWQLRNEPFLDTIKNPKYVIYVWIDGQIHRLDMYGWLDDFMYNKNVISQYLKYKEVDGHLVEVHDLFPILRRTALANIIGVWKKDFERDLFYEDIKFRESRLSLLKLHFMESKKLINKKWPMAKIIILDYEYHKYKTIDESPYADFWKQIQRDGFIYINTQWDLGVTSSEEKYHLSNSDPHPNEHAWDVIVPQLVKKLGEMK